MPVYTGAEGEMSTEKICINCAFSKELKKKIAFESSYRVQKDVTTKCTIGYRILPDGRPGRGCDGKFFERKKI